LALSKQILAAAAVTILVIAGGLAALTMAAPEDSYGIIVEIDAPKSGSTVSGVIHIATNYTSKSAAARAVLTIDAQKVSTVLSPPFTFPVNTAEFSNGAHTIMVTMINKANRSGFAMQTITFNNGGTTLAISSPEDGAFVNGTVHFQIDPVGPRNMSYIVVSIDGIQVGNKTHTPFDFPVDTTVYENGLHNVTALAVDILGTPVRAAAKVFVDNPFTIADDRGVPVNFPRTPQRIVSLGSSYTEVFFAIGADQQLVGRDSSSKYPAAASNLTDCGGYYSTLKMEVLISLQPDCVVTWTSARNYIPTIESFGIEVLAFNPTSIAGVEKVIFELGNLTAKINEAKALVKNMNDRMHLVTERIKDIPLSERPLVYYELTSKSSVGKNTMTNDIIIAAGGRNIYANSTVQYPPFSAENIIRSNPGVILIDNASLRTNSELASILGPTVNAVNDNRIYRIDGRIVSATPRLVDAIEEMVDYFYPR